jgi:VIT1/CCC1 family predicted Fe2+/Mn2+ transporter
MQKRLLALQGGEISGHHIYKRIATRLPDADNRRVIERLAAGELNHYLTWKKYTQQDVAPNWLLVWLFGLAARVLGFTFAIKLLEQGEEKAQLVYAELARTIPEAAIILAEEEVHEQELLGMLDEERLHYIGSVVLGLNDALVELTGVLAGLTLAFQNTQAISLATAVVIIAVFNYYIAVARGESFRRRFVEMAGVSLGVALFSFVIGYIIRQWLGVDI